MDVELRHLRAFAAVAKDRSFTAASKRLLITQPALSRTVQQLEASLGVRLLERTSRTVTLTAAGQEFLTRVAAILRDVDLAIAEARGERELCIGFSWVLPDPWAADTIAAFEAETGATAHLVRRDDLADALARGEVDVALVRHALADAEVVVLTLFEEPRYAAVSSRSPLAALGEIDWRDLGEHPVVINTASGNTRPELWPADQRPERVIECGNYDEWIALIAADRGVGATPRSATRTYAHAGVVFLPAPGAPPVPLSLAWLPRRATPLLRRFAEVALAHSGPASPPA